MEAQELLNIISRDEDSKHQFKSNATHTGSLASEMVAFNNSGGGQIFIGVNDDGSISGLTRDDLRRLNQLVFNAASQSVRPPVNPQTENIALPDGLVMVVTLSDGISKPYMDGSGSIWVKSGSDKRKVTAREEMQRMFQSAGFFHGDEVPASGMTIAELDKEYFEGYFEKEFGEKIDSQQIPLSNILENMNLMKEGVLNIFGALLFSKKPQYKLPVFIVKAIAFPGNEIHATQYRDSQDITGKLEDICKQSLGFIMRNLHYIQKDQDVNSLGEPEIPKIALEELLVNALIHRDYFISSPVRIFIFDNRIEIISPGHLPNNLTIENIKSGNSVIRNPILASFATKILPYRGLGSGIRRALKEYPDIDLEDDRDGNQFKVIIRRRGQK